MVTESLHQPDPADHSARLGAVLAAIVGLVGVILGAAITAGVPLMLDRRREARAVKAALRLIAIEVMQAINHATDALEEGKWWVGDTPRADAWEETRGLLAATLKGEDWWMLVTARAGIGHLNAAAEVAFLERRDTLTPADRELLEEILHELRAVDAGITGRLAR